MKYLLLAASATALFFAAYWFLMRREKRHTMVRFYLIGTLLLSFLLPAIHLRLAVPQQHIATNSPSIASTTSLPSMASLSSTASTASAASVNSVSFAQVLLWVWLTGLAVATALLTVRVLRLRRRMRVLPFREEDGIRLTLLDDDTPAFSFGKHIVVGAKGFSDAEVQQLVGHETVHVRQGHTVDTLLCEVAKAVLWFDPFIYLYARELKRVHEYIADSAMMSARMKGCTSLINSPILQPVIDTQVNIMEPKGGVRPPIMMLTFTTMPKWTRSMPAALTKGTISGARMMSAAPPSRNMPMISRATFRISSTRYLLLAMPLTALSRVLGMFSQVR